MSLAPQLENWSWVSLMNAAVVYLDAELNLRICNELAAELFDASLAPGDVVKLETCLSPGRDEYHVLTSIVRENRQLKDTVSVWDTDGRMRHVLIDSFLITDARDDVTGVVITIKDLGNFTSLEQQVQRQEKLATVGKVAAGVAHEIRNPLTTIKGFLQMLSTRIENGSASVERYYIDVMLEEINRVDLLVSELLMLSRPAQLASVPVNLGQLLEELHARTRSRAFKQGIDIHLALCDVPLIYGDPELLQQVFLNLIDNGLEAMEEGGTLTIRLRASDDDIIVDVTDTGPGIPYYQTDRIFDAFFTTKESGIGLGLPICQRIVQDHGGEIRVSSKGFGATFTVLLPVSAKKQGEQGGICIKPFVTGIRL